MCEGERPVGRRQRQTNQHQGLVPPPPPPSLHRLRLDTLTLVGTVDLPSDILEVRIDSGGHSVFDWEYGSERLQGPVRIEVPVGVSVLGDFVINCRCRTSELRCALPRTSLPPAEGLRAEEGREVDQAETCRG